MWATIGNVHLWLPTREAAKWLKKQYSHAGIKVKLSTEHPYKCRSIEVAGQQLVQH